MSRGLHVAAWVAALLYVVVGLLELILADGTLAHRVTFAVVLGLFAALVLLGVRLIDDRPWIGAAMASAGAIAGGLALFWTIAAVLLAIAIVTLSVLAARRASEPSAQPA
jgi:intracellular septation protein A